MTRRAFLGGGTAAMALSGCRRAEPEWRWEGVVFGAPARVTLRGGDGSRLVAGWMSLVRRFDEVFSLWRDDSALRTLNRAGRLESAPPELVEALRWSRAFHAQTGGAYDPTVETYLQWLQTPEGRSEGEVLEAVGLEKVRVEGRTVVLPVGTILSFNAMVQGWLTDEVAAYLIDEGASSALINMGEWRAVGGPWVVEAGEGSYDLTDRALAVSSGGGTRIAGRGHLIVPSTGVSAPDQRTVVVTAPEARLADGVATVAALVGREAVRGMGFEGVQIH